MALVTATQCARFVLLCGILEVIVGMWSCFDVFVARGMRIHVTYRWFLYARQVVFFCCCTWTNTVGIWSRFDVFVPLYLTICHVHTHIYVYIYVHIYVYTNIYTYIYMYVWQGKLCCLYCNLPLMQPKPLSLCQRTTRPVGMMSLE